MKYSIESINDFGLGVINLPEEKIYIPYTLPAERVVIDDITKHGKYKTADLLSLENPHPNRITPPCKYFGQCGGCQLQHMNESFYQEFKINLVKKALLYLNQNQNLLSNCFFTNYKQRRRTKLRAHIEDKNLILGYYALHSHKLINIEHCLLLNDQINAVIPKIRNVLLNFTPRILSSQNPIEISLTSSNNGFDLGLRSKYPPTNKEKENLLSLPESIIRIYWHDNDQAQIIRKLDTPVVDIYGEETALPLDAFLQVSTESQNSIIKFILSKLTSQEKILDLFAGIGTYSLPLSKHALIYAIDGENHLLKPLKKRKTIKTECRDLAKNPVDIRFINDFDMVIINPPRTGATNQIINLAESKVKDIIVVYCDLQAFKRDCKILLESGWKLADIAMIDQFFQSYHVEVVGHLTR